MTKDEATTGGAGDERDEAGPNLALLKWIVIGLGLLIVIGLAVVIVTIANRMGGSAARQEAESTGDPARLPAAFGRAAIQAGPDTEIVDASAGGGVILLILRAPGGADAVVVLDAATGRERGRLELDRRPETAGQGPESGAPGRSGDPDRSH